MAGFKKRDYTIHCYKDGGDLPIEKTFTIGAVHIEDGMHALRIAQATLGVEWKVHNFMPVLKKKTQTGPFHGMHFEKQHRS